MSHVLPIFIVPVSMINLLYLSRISLTPLLLTARFHGHILITDKL